jgi:protein-S-isoprenylcysteine O-methyltransferase Ste14
VLTFVALECLVCRVEELHLLALQGDAYRAYARTVSRFVPSIGRLPAGGTESR